MAGFGVASMVGLAAACTRSTPGSPGCATAFRWYWARFSPGIILIREISLRLVKKEAERRALCRTIVRE